MATQTLHRERWHALALRHVPATAPFDWMTRAWKDLEVHPAASLAYGLIVATIGLVLLAYPMHPYVLAALLTSFMLVAPVLAAGLVALSRLHSIGEVASFDQSLLVLKRYRGPLLRFALLLAVIAALWFAISGLVLAQIFASTTPALTGSFMGDVLANATSGQLLAYFTVGGVFAALVFTLSAVTVPAIIDRGCGVRQAMATSVRAVFAADLPAMLLWAGICALLVALGFISMMVGMAVIFPLLGHASWYAYLDLVK